MNIDKLDKAINLKKELDKCKHRISYIQQTIDVGTWGSSSDLAYDVGCLDKEEVSALYVYLKILVQKKIDILTEKIELL